MKTTKLINKIARLLFSRSQLKREQQKKELQEALQQLKKKQKELDALLEACQDPAERQALVEKINILKAQRGKGLGKLRTPDIDTL